jgi:cytochrome oxidase Cu insertion factor (SCO1/SenC/PrrC family)
MDAGAGAGGRPHLWALSPARIVGFAVLAVVIGVGVGVVIHQLTARSAAAPEVAQFRYGMHGTAAWPEGAQVAPMINTLPDQTRHLFSLASLRGRTVAIVFFDSHCHQECPLEGRALSAAERVLPASQRPVLVAVSVNPQDTPASAASAVRAWGLAAVAQWHWVMGTRRQLAPIWAAYHIYVSPKPINGDINHTEALYLVDRRGYERSAYLWPFASKFVTLDLRTLARGREAG